MRDTSLTPADQAGAGGATPRLRLETDVYVRPLLATRPEPFSWPVVIATWPTGDENEFKAGASSWYAIDDDGGCYVTDVDTSREAAALRVAAELSGVERAHLWVSNRVAVPGYETEYLTVRRVIFSQAEATSHG